MNRSEIFLLLLNPPCPIYPFRRAWSSRVETIRNWQPGSNNFIFTAQLDQNFTTIIDDLVKFDRHSRSCSGRKRLLCSSEFTRWSAFFLCSVGAAGFLLATEGLVFLLFVWVEVLFCINADNSPGILVGTMVRRQQYAIQMLISQVIVEFIWSEEK